MGWRAEAPWISYRQGKARFLFYLNVSTRSRDNVALCLVDTDDSFPWNKAIGALNKDLYPSSAKNRIFRCQAASLHMLLCFPHAEILLYSTQEEVYIIVMWVYYGVRQRSWSRHCATSWKVAGSMPVGVIRIFHWHNPSRHSLDLG